MIVYATYGNKNLRLYFYASEDEFYFEQIVDTVEEERLSKADQLKFFRLCSQGKWQAALEFYQEYRPESEDDEDDDSVWEATWETVPDAESLLIHSTYPERMRLYQQECEATLKGGK